MLDDVEIADDCVTTGICLLGNHVRVRTGSCISKSVIVDDWCFVAAGIMSSHTKNIYHARPNAPKKQLITRFGYGSVIGSRTNTSAGVSIAPGAIVGYGSHVTVDLTEPNGVYYNDPHPYATLQRRLETGQSLLRRDPGRLRARTVRPGDARQVPAARVDSGSSAGRAAVSPAFTAAQITVAEGLCDRSSSTRVRARRTIAAPRRSHRLDRRRLRARRGRPGGYHGRRREMAWSTRPAAGRSAAAC